MAVDADANQNVALFLKSSSQSLKSNLIYMTANGFVSWIAAISLNANGVATKFTNDGKYIFNMVQSVPEYQVFDITTGTVLHKYRHTFLGNHYVLN